MKILSVTPEDLPGAPDGLRRVEYSSGVDGLTDWAMVLPPTRGTAWIVCIHGHNSHGDQLYTRQDIRDNWLPEFLSRHFGILTPNLRDKSWMGPAAARDLHDLLHWVRTEHGARQFIFASGSMGGTSNLIYSVLHPEDVAGAIGLGVAPDLARYHAWCRPRTDEVIVDICDAIETSYGGPPSRNPKVYEEHSALARHARLTMPVFVSHGTQDGLMPIAPVQEFAKAMAGQANFRYREIPEGGHDSPLWRMKEALDWVAAR